MGCCDWCMKPPDTLCCGERSPEQRPGFESYLCSREAGHDGDHVACAMQEHCLAKWPQSREGDECET